MAEPRPEVPEPDGEAVGCYDKAEGGCRGEPPARAKCFLSVPEVDGMPLRFFAIPVSNGAASEQELNAFLARHKVLSIDRRLIDQGVNSFWAICMEQGVVDDLKGSNRVNRGGSWNNDAANCRTANRNTNDPTNRTNNNGFRLALNSAGKEAIALRLQTEQVVFQTEQVSA